MNMLFLLLNSILLILTHGSHVEEDCATWYEQTQHGSAYRNVKNYGAKGDGVTDDTKAFQDALTQGRSSAFSIKNPAIVYVPAGTYIVSDTLNMYFYTHLIGNFKCRPTLKLADNAPGFSSGQKYMMSATMNPSGEHVSNFYHQVHHIDLDLGNGNTNAVGIHWAVAQATSLRNMTINVGSAKSAIFCENGGGGFIGDIKVIGGDVGLMIGGQQWTLRDIVIEGSRTTGIQFFWDWVFSIVGLTVSKVPTGVEFKSSAAGSLVLIDSSFTDVNISVSTDFPLPLRGVYLERLSATRVNYIANQLRGNPSGPISIEAWAQGFVYEGQNIVSTSSGNVKPLGSGPFFRQARPVVSGDVFNVLDAGAKGDGTTDDTDAIQKAIHDHDMVFFPYGTYIISDTVQLGPNSVLIGEALSILCASGKGQSKFLDASNPVPMLSMPAGTSPLLMDLTLTANDEVPGCIMMDWHATTGFLYDVHSRLYHGINTGMHIHAKSSVYMENTWLWTADHDIDSGQLINVTSPNGLLYEGSGPSWFYGTAVEHNSLYQYNVSQGSNAYFIMTQTETPYWQSPPSAIAMNIQQGENIYMFGSGYYSWFNGNQTTVFQLQDCQSCASVAHNVYGIENRITGDINIPAVYNDTFCSTWIVNYLSD